MLWILLGLVVLLGLFGLALFLNNLKRKADIPEPTVRTALTAAKAALATRNAGSCNAACKAKADADLKQYADLLDVMVDLTGYYETASGGYGNPYNPGAISQP